jgi:hypothetical protein
MLEPIPKWKKKKLSKYAAIMDIILFGLFCMLFVCILQVGKG